MIQQAINKTLGSAAAAAGVVKGIGAQQEQAEAAKVQNEISTNKLANTQKQGEILQQRVEQEKVRLEQETAKKAQIEAQNVERIAQAKEKTLQEKLKTKTAKADLASKELQAYQKQGRVALDNLLQAAQSKQLGSKYSTKRSIVDYLMEAAGGKIGKETAQMLAKNMSNSERRKFKEKAGAKTNGNTEQTS